MKEHKLDLEIKAELYHQKIVIWLNLGLMAIIACDQSNMTEGTDSTSTDVHDIGTILSHFHW